MKIHLFIALALHANNIVSPSELQCNVPNFQERRGVPNSFCSFISSFFEPAYISNAASYFSNICADINRLHQDRQSDKEYILSKLKTVYETRYAFL
jgi:hypothetical protein